MSATNCQGAPQTRSKRCPEHGMFTGKMQSGTRGQLMHVCEEALHEGRGGGVMSH